MPAAKKTAMWPTLSEDEQKKRQSKAGEVSGLKRWGCKPVRNRKQLIERFWSKVDRKGENECWPYLPCKGKNKYGEFRAKYGATFTGAHRFALEIRLGRKIRPGMWALHTCDRKDCVNPQHLFEGSPKDNSEDMVSKNRQSRGDSHARCIKNLRVGEDNGNSKMSNATARKIKKLYEAGGQTFRGLAKKFGFSRHVIKYAIFQRKGI